MNENETVSIGSSWGQAVSISVDPACSSDSAYIFVNDPTTGVYSSAAAIVNFAIHSHVDDVYELFFAGKTIKENADEYLDVIERLPNINNKLDAIEVLEFFRVRMFPEDDEK